MNSTDLSEQVATRDLKQLVSLRLLSAQGENRGRYYIAGPKLTAFRDALAEPPPRAVVIDPF